MLANAREKGRLFEEALQIAEISERQRRKGKIYPTTQSSKEEQGEIRKPS